MTIKITWKTVAIAAAAALSVYTAYKAAKADDEKRKKVQAHKDDVLSERDLMKEMKQASTENESFSPDQRADAHSVLRHQYWKVKDASTIEEFDDQLGSLDCMIKQFRDDDKNKALSYLLVWMDRQREEKEKEGQLREDRIEKNRLRTEKEKADKIADAIKNAVRTMKYPSTYNVEKLIDTASTVVIGR